MLGILSPLIPEKPVKTVLADPSSFTEIAEKLTEVMRMIERDADLANRIHGVAADIGKLVAELDRAKKAGLKHLVPITRALSKEESAKLTAHFDAELGAGTWGVVKVPLVTITYNGRMKEIADPPQTNEVLEIMACRCEACLAVS